MYLHSVAVQILVHAERCPITHVLALACTRIFWAKFNFAAIATMLIHPLKSSSLSFANFGPLFVVSAQIYMRLQMSDISRNNIYFSLFQKYPAHGTVRWRKQFSILQGFSGFFAHLVLFANSNFVVQMLSGVLNIPLLHFCTNYCNKNKNFKITS